MMINVVEIKIVRGRGADRVVFVTDIGAPKHLHFEGELALTLDTRIPKQISEEYLGQTFPGVPIDINDFTEPQMKFGEPKGA